ncbi:MAG: hypothetical protein MUE54_09860, partial [Anaerolineae bacterium]|nr:hypothetical protein [Anaerolineae bacterium]
DGSIEWLALQKDVITIIQYNRGEFHGKPIPRRPWGYFMNLGFKSAQADYILMMSDDTIFHHGAIQNAINFIQEQQAMGKKVGCVPFYFHDIGHEPEHQYKVFTLFGKPLLNHGIYLKDAFQAVGYADDVTYEFYASDSDICLKMIHAGYEVLPCPTALMLHCPNHPTRYMTTSSAQWVKDITAMLNKWRGIFVDDKMTVEDIIVVNLLITYVDPHNLAQVFDGVLMQSTSDVQAVTTRANDPLVRLEYIENRLNSVLAAVRQNIQQVENNQRTWEIWATQMSRPWYRRMLSQWAIFKPLRVLKNRLMPTAVRIKPVPKE